MANKSFIVQYSIKARDSYSKAANSIAKSTKNMNAQLAASKKRFADVSATARRSGAIMTAAVTTPILLMANNLKNAARDASETESKFGTVFRNISDKSERVAKDLAKNYGLSKNASKQLLSDTGDLLTGFGFGQDSALDMSQQVNQLAVDLASFTNYAGGAEGASQAITKALLGERESLKSLGIAISAENVKKKIQQMRAEGVQFASQKQANAQATLALAYEQSQNAVGDFARTSGELANQERITKAAIDDLKVSLGKALLPVALKITKAVRSMVEWFGNLSPQVKSTIMVVAGVAAVLGPVLLVVGSISLALPALAAGFAAVGAAATIAFGPIGLIIAGLTTAIALIHEYNQEDESKARGGISAANMTSKRQRMDVGVNVGLDKGLKQTSPSKVTRGGMQRRDTGRMATR